MLRKIPVITKYLLIVNVLIFVFSQIYSGAQSLNDIFGLHFFMAPDFHIYQFVTYMFMHGGWDHLFFNMFALWMFGCVVENVWGSKKFLLYYIICGVGAGLCQELAQYGHYMIDNLGAVNTVSLTVGMRTVVLPVSDYLNMWTTVGASGAIYAILLAFGMIFPEERIFIFPLPIPIKAKWFVMLYAGVELFSAFSNSNDGVAHLAHLGGMLFGFLLIKYWKRHPYSGMGDYGASKGQQFFDRMRSSWENHTGRSAGAGQTSGWNNGARKESDWDYNARKQREQAEVDAILDKIRKSGYDSLSSEEKRRLFENSQNK